MKSFVRKLLLGSRLHREHEAAQFRLIAMETELNNLRRALSAAEEASRARMDGLERRVDEHHRQIQVRTVMDWITHAFLRTSPLVSVVLPTRNRRHLLLRAIASVQAQTYTNWELLIVDDASTDDTSNFLTGLADGKIRHFRAQGNGVCAARNIALGRAQGTLVAYLDDDNVMHPQWLKSVVWGFEQRQHANVIYGAFVVDDIARIGRIGSGDLPNLYFWPYDHQAVSVSNIADMGCIAHRAGLAEATFDESFREMGDWDLFLRLTRDAPPLGLPAIACFYTTDAPDRLTNGPTFDADLAAVLAKNRR
jgi:hypothetical protein